VTKTLYQDTKRPDQVRFEARPAEFEIGWLAEDCRALDAKRQVAVAVSTIDGVRTSVVKPDITSSKTLTDIIGDLPNEVYDNALASSHHWAAAHWHSRCGMADMQRDDAVSCGGAIPKAARQSISAALAGNAS